MPRVVKGQEREVRKGPNMNIELLMNRMPSDGPLMLKALLSQDMYLAGSFVLLLSVLTVIGTLISDILLVVVDPRIRYSSAG